MAGIAAIADEEIIGRLCVLPGIGRWIEEMLLIFCSGEIGRAHV